MNPNQPLICVRPHGWVGADAAGEPDRLLSWVQHAESLGFDGVFLGDRMLARASGPQGDVYAASMLEITTMLAAIAATTERIKVGPLVYVFPYRHPIQTAKISASLDVLADGRLILGAGIGWNRKEFEALGIEPSGRGERFEEALDIVRRLWSGEAISYQGRWWTLADIQVAPRPVQEPGPPVWLASFSPASALDWEGDVSERSRRVLDRVGRVADGWVPLIYSASAKRRLDADVLTTAWNRVLKSAQRAGRTRKDIDFVYSDWCYITDHGAASEERCQAALSGFFAGSWEEALSTYTIGSSDEVITKIERHTDGIDRVDAYVFTPLDDAEEQLDALAESILPALREKASTGS
jgi:probable F420-dependent oxidoreductase